MELDSTLRDELSVWLRLTMTPGLGPVRVRALLAAYGLPEHVFAQPRAVLADVVGPKRA